MRVSRLSERMTVFALFFGLSLLEALERGSWMNAGFWLAIAVFFRLAGTSPRRRAGAGDGSHPPTDRARPLLP